MGFYRLTDLHRTAIHSFLEPQTTIYKWLLGVPGLMATHTDLFKKSGIFLFFCCIHLPTVGSHHPKRNTPTNLKGTTKDGYKKNKPIVTTPPDHLHKYHPHLPLKQPHLTFLLFSFHAIGVLFFFPPGIHVCFLLKQTGAWLVEYSNRTEDRGRGRQDARSWTISPSGIGFSGNFDRTWRHHGGDG